MLEPVPCASPKKNVREGENACEEKIHRQWTREQEINQYTREADERQKQVQLKENFTKIVPRLGTKT